MGYSLPAPSKRFLGFDVKYLLGEWKAMVNPKTFVADLWAGITVALVALPLNLALAIAAGVEPGVGITTGIVAGLIGSLLGGQRYAVTGPAAAMAVVLIEIAQTYGIQAIWLVGMIAGVMQIISGTMRLGKLISYIPTPVIIGFANAIGTLVICNSLDDFLGLKAKPIAHAGAAAPFAGHPMVPEFIQDMSHLFYRLIVHQEANLQAIAIGALVLVIAILVPKWTRAVPGQLVAIVVASLVAAYLKFDIPRIIDIAHIPNMLPMPAIPNLPWDNLDTLFASAITVFMLGSIESLLSASVADGMTMSAKHHSDQELIGQGVANVIVPFFGGIPVTGVIARTAVNIRSGAKTRLSGIFHSLFLLGLSFALAKYAEQIPLAALSGVLVLTGFRLIEMDAFKRIWRASKTEGYIVLLTTAASVLIDLTAGVVTGLLLTCGMFIRQMSSVRILSHEDSRVENADSPAIPTCKFVRTFLIDGPLFFGAADRFSETILQMREVKVLVLHMKYVQVMDLTGAEALMSLHGILKRNGIRLVLAELPMQPWELLKRVGADEKIGTDNLFSDYKEAVITVNQEMLEKECRSCADNISGRDDGKLSGPKDCKLRNAIVLNTNQTANLIASRMPGANLRQRHTHGDEQDMSRLIAVDNPNNIPPALQGTPIEDLLKCQNFYEVENTSSNQAELVIGMCIDYRKHLHTPKNCAYIIRRTGANMQDSEFSIAIALSSGVKYMALVVHNQCVMSDPHSKRERFIEALVNEHEWGKNEASQFFDQHATSREIDDAINFSLQESARLQALFSGLRVVPLLYKVDDDRLYLIRDWVERQTTTVSVH